MITIGFGSSTGLASAYGVAVTGTFILSTILFLAVARLLWHKSRRWVVLGGSVFLTIEVAFFSANLTKVVHGGWLPLAVAAILFAADDDLAPGKRDRHRQPPPAWKARCRTSSRAWVRRSSGCSACPESACS